MGRMIEISWTSVCIYVCRYVCKNVRMNGKMIEISWICVCIYVCRYVCKNVRMNVSIHCMTGAKVHATDRDSKRHNNLAVGNRLIGNNSMYDRS